MGDDPKSNKIRTQTHNGVTWIDVQSGDAETFAQLEQKYHLHPLHLKESVQKVQHTEVEREKDYLFVVFHYPVLQAGATKISVGQVGIFLGKNYLLTVHAHTGSCAQSLYSECEYSQERAKEFFGQGSAYLLYVIIRRLLDDISRLTEVVEDELDNVEGLVFDNSVSDARRISKVRQKIVKLRRLIGPKREVLQDLTEQVESFMGSEMSRYYANNLKLVNRLWEVIEEAKETVEIYKDADFTTNTERTNRILTLLTLVFTFTIPVTVLASLYGMNVFVPGGLEAGSWMFLGRYTTFVVVIGLATGIAGVMYWYFKRKDRF